MNRHRISSNLHQYLSLSQKRPRSVAIEQIQRTIKIVMFAAFALRFDSIHGFSRGITSICASLHPYPLSLIGSPLNPMIATTSCMGSKNSKTFTSQSSSSLAISKSTSSSRGDKFHSVSLSIPTMEIMEEVGALIAILSKQTDVLFLDGDLGAGKTTFSRGFIKCKLGMVDDCSDDEESDGNDDTTGEKLQQTPLRITSPTYLLSNTYEYIEDDDHDGEDGANQTREIHHMDLYRLSGKSSRDFEPLGLSRVFSNCISLIEWPSRLLSFPELLPSEETLLKIDLRIPDPTSDERIMSLVSSSKSSWTARLKFLIDEGMVDDLLLHSDHYTGDIDDEDHKNM